MAQGSTPQIKGLSSKTPKIYNLPMPVANTEYSQALSANTKQFLLRARGTSKLRIAYTVGETATKYLTLDPRESLEVLDLSLTGVIIYARANHSSEILEIQEWS
jgi:hypothetical protein